MVKKYRVNSIEPHQHKFKHAGLHDEGDTTVAQTSEKGASEA
jgi:hypothetical protein